MPNAIITFKEFRLQPTVPGSGNEEFNSEVLVDFQIASRIYGDEIIPIRFPSLEEYPHRNFEIGPLPNLYGSEQIPSSLLKAAIHAYVEIMVDAGKRIVISRQGTDEMRIEDCTISIPMKVTIDWK